MLPAPVLEKAQAELREWHSTGVSVMEMSHRGKDFIGIAGKAPREKYSIAPECAHPDAILLRPPAILLRPGITPVASRVMMLPFSNKWKRRRSAWSGKAIAEARLYGQVQVAASAKDSNFTMIPPVSRWNVDTDAAYLHYTANETIGGVEFHAAPEVDGFPLVADMSSNILSRPVDVRRFGLIYGSAQKNIGVAGITVVIVREDLIGQTLPGTPSIFDYRQQADNGSMVNTPPTYNWYLTGLALEWLKEQGGMKAIQARNIRKAEKLYAAIDASTFYSNPVDPAVRSRMNVPFRPADVM